MRRIDEPHPDHPFAGGRMPRGPPNGEGIAIGRDPVGAMMRRMGIEAPHRRPNASKPGAGHRIHPYPPRGPAIGKANHAWAMDTTRIPMARGLVHPTAVPDRAARRVPSRRIPITMGVDFRLDAVGGALARYGGPEILNSGRGSQFTSAALAGLLADHAIAIGMDGRGAWRDNAFVGRLRRSARHGEVHLRARDGVAEARASIGRHPLFHNGKRPHSGLDARTPDQACFGTPPLAAVA